MPRPAAAACAALALIAAAPAAAQVSAEANIADVDGWGGELGLGFDMPLVPALLTLTPGSGVFVHEGGPDEDGADVDLYGRVEATTSIAHLITLGAGVRVAHDVDAYGVVGIPLAPLFQLRGKIGEDYLAAGIRLGF